MMGRLTDAVNRNNALGRDNLAEKGVELSEAATNHEIMQGIAEVSGGEFKSFADKTYERFGIDKVAYPYLAIGVLSSNSTYIEFSEVPLSATEKRPSKYISRSTIEGIENETDNAVVYGWCVGKFPTNLVPTSITKILPDGVHFANYPIEETETVKYYPL